MPEPLEELCTPWRVSGEGSAVFDKNDECIASVYGEVPASLMAAAPDLAKALEVCLTALERTDITRPEVDEIIPIKIKNEGWRALKKAGWVV